MSHISPEPVAHLSQHRLVPMLLRCATSNAVGSTVLFDRTATDVRQNGDTVTVVTRTSQVCSLVATYSGTTNKSCATHWPVRRCLNRAGMSPG